MKSNSKSQKGVLFRGGILSHIIGNIYVQYCSARDKERLEMFVPVIAQNNKGEKGGKCI